MEVATTRTPPKRDGRDVFPGFDALRLFASLAVIFSHAFIIAAGSTVPPSDSWMYTVIYRMGNYAVYAFFAMSGFLLAGSLELNPSGIKYGVNRILRILPAYLFYVLVLLFVIGPLVTSVTLKDYFSSEQLSANLRFGIDAFDEFGLPGVFNYEGRLSSVLNGSLWSLHYEALSYLFLLVAWMALRRADFVAVFVAGLAIVTTSSELAQEWWSTIAATLPYFAGGVVMHTVHRRFGVSVLGAWISAACFLITCFLGVAETAFSVFGSYLVIFFGLRPNALSAVIARRGDISYGMYLFGWPIEQVLRQVTHTQRPMLLFLMAVPATAVFAYASCHLVERPAMRIRRPLADWINRLVDRLVSVARLSRAGAMWGGQIALIVSGGFYLLSPRRSWYVLSTVGVIAIICLVGALIGGAIATLLNARARRTATPPDSLAPDTSIT